MVKRKMYGLRQVKNFKMSFSQMGCKHNNYDPADEKQVYLSFQNFKEEI